MLHVFRMAGRLAPAINRVAIPASLKRLQGDTFSVHVPDSELPCLATEVLADVAHDVHDIRTSRTCENWNVELRIERKAARWNMHVRSTAQAAPWLEQWPIREFLSDLVLFLAEGEGTVEPISGGYDLVRTARHRQPIVSLVSDAYADHERILREVRKRLRATWPTNEVIVEFNFPPDLRATCEQYLLSFVDFLHDLGVDATADLEHRAQEVLFSIRPVDRMDALERIRVALSVYLRFPFALLTGSPQGLSEELMVRNVTAAVGTPEVPVGSVGGPRTGIGSCHGSAAIHDSGAGRVVHRRHSYRGAFASEK
jgi:hypothetical protein